MALYTFSYKHNSTSKLIHMYIAKQALQMIAMPCVIVMIQIVSNTNIINGNTALNYFKSL